MGVLWRIIVNCRRREVCAPGIFVSLIVLSGCGGVPPPKIVPPTIPFETKMSWIVSLEDRRILNDPAPAPVVAPAPATAKTAPPTGAKSKVAPPPPPPSPDLIRLLTDEEARVRRRAALAVGRVGLRDAVPTLTKVLAGDPEFEVRQMAAFALGLIGDRAAAESLRVALMDSSPIVQGRAAEALGLVGDDMSASAIGEMVARHIQAGALAQFSPDDLTYPLDPPVEAARLGLYALARLKAYDALARAVLDESAQPRVRWWPVAFALQRTGDKRAIPALRTLAQTDTTYTRAFAVRGLGELGDENAASVVMPLIAPRAPDSLPRVEAIRAAGRLGIPKAGEALMAIAFSGTASPLMRVEALQALTPTNVGDGREGLLDLVSDKSPAVRAAVFSTLAKLESEMFLTILSGLEPDPQWSVRAAVATALGTFPAEMVAPRLRAMLGDSDLRVIPAVLTSLTKIKAPKIEAILLEYLKHDDPIIRMAAATNLAELKPDGIAGALSEAYRFGERDSTYVARAAALSALAKYGAPAAAETLSAALKDKDWAVRLRAAELLKPLDASIDAENVIRPMSGAREASPAEISQMVSPTVSPHVFVETDKGTIELELAVLDAPVAAQNFMTLARKGFFEGVTFHRVVANFVIQGGDPRGDGEGGPGYTIRDEINQRPYLRGTLGMALDWEDTGGSQFFITHSPHPHLDTRYTVFGHVVSGMETVDRIEPGDVIRKVRVWDGVQLTAR
jgi:cyclophilin family peptidyl-prolyl cis-trans isomerase/HEAT repeat protein